MEVAKVRTVQTLMKQVQGHAALVQRVETTDVGTISSGTFDDSGKPTFHYVELAIPLRNRPEY